MAPKEWKSSWNSSTKSSPSPPVSEYPSGPSISPYSTSPDSDIPPLELSPTRRWFIDPSKLDGPEYDIDIREEPTPILMPELYEYSITATRTQAPISPDLSPLSRPVTITANPFSPRIRIRKTLAPPPRSPLDQAIHQTTYALASLNTLRSGIQNIPLTHFNAPDIPLLFPHTTSLVATLNSTIPILDYVLETLELHASTLSLTLSPLAEQEEFSPIPSPSFVSAILRITNQLGPSLEGGCALLRDWTGRDADDFYRYTTRKGIDGQAQHLGLGLGGVERGVRGLTGWFGKGAGELELELELKVEMEREKEREREKVGRRKRKACCGMF